MGVQGPCHSSGACAQVTALEGKLRVATRERAAESERHAAQTAQALAQHTRECSTLRADADALRARVAELESLVLAAQPRKRLSVNFPKDGSKPVLTRRNSDDAAITPEEARILMLTKQNQREKKKLAASGQR